ncbi:hypothetical protein GALMADRAFT_270925, partial [Galerina marginata CBS 339.88]
YEWSFRRLANLPSSTAWRVIKVIPGFRVQICLYILVVQALIHSSLFVFLFYNPNSDIGLLQLQRKVRSASRHSRVFVKTSTLKWNEAQLVI